MANHRPRVAQLPALSARYRLLVWDAPDYTGPRPGRKDFSIFHAAEYLAALLNHLGYQQAVLVGQSLGADTVLEFAYRYPERVIALVVFGELCWTNLPLRQGNPGPSVL